MSENIAESYRSFGTVDSPLNRISSIRLKVPGELTLTDTVSSQLFDSDRLKVFEATLESSDSSSSKNEISRNISSELSNLAADFSWSVDKLHKTCLRRISAPEKSELCLTKDSTETTNKFRKLPLKRISGQLKSNSRITNCPKSFNDRFRTYDPYLQRQRSSENYSFANMEELKMPGNTKLLNILPDETAKLELQNSFISAQKRYYLNRQENVRE
ncbi:hypothetical protein HNY73_010923 [Argiope bruennichi]|uniref:Uncharacterized protein n=1 Tax=Argiope bruennichi TaxID=94029 RepID=A0A8T0F2L8_ARGBR|nr:hypothetical protein HNY73_010923 [Argiope bruennichi]